MGTGKQTVAWISAICALLLAPFYSVSDRWFPTSLKIAFLGSASQLATKTSAAKKLFPVTVATARRQRLPVTVTSLGTIEASKEVAIVSRVDSAVNEVLVQEGAIVEENQVLLRLDARLIQAELDKAKAEVARSEVRIAQAMRSLKRQTELETTGAASRVKAEDAKSEIQALSFSHLALKAQLSLLEAQLDFHTIRAPMRGMVGAINAYPGSVLKSGDRATEITRLKAIDTLHVSTAIPQRDYARLQKCIERGDLTVQFRPEGTTESIPVRHRMTGNSFEERSAMLSVKGEIINTKYSLLPGMLGETILSLGYEEGVAVPRSAIRQDQEGQVVVVVGKDQKVDIRPIRVLLEHDGSVLVSDGVSADETVVVEGQFRLTAGDFVKTSTAKSAGLE